MLHLIGKSDIKLIKNMVDVVYTKSMEGLENAQHKRSHRGNYTLNYTSWYNRVYECYEYHIELLHYGTCIFEYESRLGSEKLKHIYVCSDSDRNAINTLISYLGLIKVKIYRKDWCWYVDIPTALVAGEDPVTYGSYIPVRPTWLIEYRFK